MQSINQSNGSHSQNEYLQQASAMKDRIVSSLTDLLNCFDTPSDYIDEKNNLCSNISKDINFHNFADYVLNVSNFISTMQKKSSSKEKEFYKTVENQLKFFYSFLMKESEAILNSHKGDVEFQDKFQSHVQAMSNEVNDISDTDSIENMRFKMMNSISNLNLELSKYREIKEVQIQGFNEKFSQFEQKIKILKDDYRDMASHFNSKIEELNEEKETDPLTKVKNRNGYHKVMNNLYHDYLQKQKNNEKSNLNLVMCDIDYFKQINDEHGHDAGDKMLIAIAKLIKEELRNSDEVCRIGGEEFVIIMTESYYSDCLKVIERIRKKIENTKFSYDTKSINITCSFGFAYFDENDDVPTDVFKRADEALYSSKNEGRNMIHLNDPVDHNGIISYQDLIS